MIVLAPVLLVLLQAPDCRFQVTAPPAPAAVQGPGQPAPRGRILEQPDAPLRIVRAEVTDEAIRFDVTNASDRTIAGAVVGFEWRQGGRFRTGTAGFDRPLEPSGAIRLNAQLSEPIPADSPVLLSVRSVRVEACTYLPARAMARPAPTRGRRVPAVPLSPEQRRCAFAVSAGTEPPDVLGSADLVARTQVAEQPDSPLRVRRVDLTRLKTNIGESWIQLRGQYTIDVENVSDQPIEVGMVSLMVLARGPGDASSPLWEGALAPGRLKRLSREAAAIADFEAGVTPADVRLLVLVQNVVFERCSYAPGRAFPTPATPGIDKRP